MIKKLMMLCVAAMAAIGAWAATWTDSKTDYTWTFYGCISLAEVNLPVTVKTIDSYAFYGCSALKTLNIPYGVEEIENIGRKIFSARPKSAEDADALRHRIL